ncbi:RluA family pseudouridine synthase [Prochlorococcus sp. MIT 1300]|uniref:RluA family pseudouridine synthase n=1 Tax=Prochlorococcus sp. MIT 1300 TaxID=3096218 RepID=UPI002A757730|nr:RluA family pseudouridine synthase [Prochlorococcus sp. MIT 1300]
MNNGWAYSYIVKPVDSGSRVVYLLAKRYGHSSVDEWQGRLDAGEILLNDIVLRQDKIIVVGDNIVWERPPWEEPSIPHKWEVVFDNDDLLVINKPSGLPVMAGGGYLQHTLTTLLKKEAVTKKKLLFPAPVHRLGRFTSGLIICARKPETRALLSAIFRRSTTQSNSIKKVYRALTMINKNLVPGKILELNQPIAENSHPLIGKIWGPPMKESKDYKKDFKGRLLKASSHIKLIERREDADLLEITIKTGRPHQIRIHLAMLGSPLIGDPLYKSHGKIAQNAVPGDGGYLLHAYQLNHLEILGERYSFKANLPKRLIAQR